MKDSPQPFTDHVTKRSASAKSVWATAGLVGIVIFFSLAFWFSAKNAREQRAEWQSKLDAATAEIAKSRADAETNQTLITSLKSQLADLESEKEAVKEKAKSLEEEMRSGLESKDVTISKLQGKLTVNILDRVMFDSGEAVLKPDGEAVMVKMAAFLEEHPELKIHIIGHTDNIPIRSEAHARFASNWELSTARALAALHFLTEKAGVDPHRVGAVGYGEFRPVADNLTAEGRAKNRRIAIVILPEEIAEADTRTVGTSEKALLP